MQRRQVLRRGTTDCAHCRKECPLAARLRTHQWLRERTGEQSGGEAGAMRGSWHGGAWHASRALSRTPSPFPGRPTGTRRGNLTTRVGRGLRASRKQCARNGSVMSVTVIGE